MGKLLVHQHPLASSSEETVHVLAQLVLNLKVCLCIRLPCVCLRYGLCGVLLQNLWRGCYAEGLGHCWG